MEEERRNEKKKGGELFVENHLHTVQLVLFSSCFFILTLTRQFIAIILSECCDIHRTFEANELLENL